MPYTQKQCALFGRMASGKPTGKGKNRKRRNPPSDWRKQCRRKKR